MPDVTLLTGGGRSGKSDYAVTLAMARARRAFIATAEPFDDEMRARIAAHRAGRGNAFATIEAPVDLAGAVRGLPAGTDVVVIDCLTVWLGNLMHRDGQGEQTSRAIAELLDVLREPPCDVIVVTNEVGLGIIPENAMARQFRDLAGGVNTRVARLANRVVLMISGIPLTIKGTAP